MGFAAIQPAHNLHHKGENVLDVVYDEVCSVFLTQYLGTLVPWSESSFVTSDCPLLFVDDVVL